MSSEREIKPCSEHNGACDAQHLTPKTYRRTNVSARIFPETPDDEVVISGVSGRFPSTDNVEEFAYNLYNKIDMVTDREVRWSHSLSQELPKRKGVINDLSKFDATFFGIHYKQANAMDPQGRQLIECAYEAILDAGMHPQSLRDTRTGVFVAVCFSETEKSLLFDTIHTDGFSLAGCSRAMMSNRISYCMGLKGPSYTIDTACSSSMFALDCAFTALRTGQCDHALVCGTNLLLHPYTTINFFRLGVLSPDGVCRPFDQNASGYTRSESICALFLQKAKTAKRIYANVVYSNTNCDGYKPEGITYPSGKMQEQLLSDFYNDLSLDPTTISYVEAHGTGTRVGDPEECKTLDRVFCQNRKEPLLVGSVKSSIGHTEASSGICSITKVILAFETGIVPPNINFNEIRKEIPALIEGRLKVCVENTPLPGNLVAVNSFGFGGANAHALFSRFEKTKIDNGAPKDSVPRLVLWAGRTAEAVDRVFNALDIKPLDTEFIALIQGIQQYDVSGNLYRGYGIYEHTEIGKIAKCITRVNEHVNVVKRPIVWIFTGMGSQWIEMGSPLMQIEIFRNSIEKCHKVLEPHGINLISIITSTKKETFDNIVNSFVGIAAIQVALVDILRALEIPFDFCIGHSVGELGCAYADGTVTAEQMVLAAYARGMVSCNVKVIDGSMAAVGLSYSQIKNRVPENIEIACHNSSNSATISGPKNDVAQFVNQLKNEKIFAKEVQCSNIPYHSKYIAAMGPKLLAKMKEIIPEPKKRSAKWLSTSVNKSEWHIEKNQYSSSEYHTNNLLSPVLFEETSQYLPQDAITIEIAPHGLLQAIIKKELPNGIHIPLTQRGNTENAAFLLTALGKLFINGVSMPLERIYPAINYPVSRGTQMISPLIKWDHSQDWFVSVYDVNKTEITSERKLTINIAEDEYQYMSGHIIDGRCLLPATAYLHLVRETLVYMTPGQNFFGLNIEFENVKFLRATSLVPDTGVNLTVVVHCGSGHFEISEGTTAIVNGTIRCVKDPKPMIDLNVIPDPSCPMLTGKEFYKELRLRGYNYANIFKSVVETRADGLSGKVKWVDGNWAAFMDCLLQINILSKDSRSLYLPTSIRKIRINTEKHLEEIAKLDPENPVLDVKMSKELQAMVCGGIEIVGMTVSSVSRRNPPGTEVIEAYQFVPYNCDSIMYSKEDAISILLQIGHENMLQQKIKLVEVFSGTDTETPIIQLFNETLTNTPLIMADLILLSDKKFPDLEHITLENADLKTHHNCHYIVASQCLDNVEFMEQAQASLIESGFIILRENYSLIWGEVKIPTGFNLISIIKIDSESLIMMQRAPAKPQTEKAIVEVSSSDPKFEWLDKLQKAIQNGPTLAVSEKEKYSGIIGLVNCIRREPDGNKLNCVQIDAGNAPKFSNDNQFYSAQLKLNLAMNVLRNGEWGSYRHVEISDDCEEQPRDGHVYANLKRLGDLSSFAWMTGPMDKSACINPVNIQFSSINFRDIMLATGRLPPEMHSTSRLNQQCLLGLEYSGVDSSGDRVMGMVAIGALATHVEPLPNLTWKVPSRLTLQEAATIPAVYTTIYYAFFFYRPISKGQTILIHAGSGGIGLAAIRVAFAYGMEVYTTVSNKQKREFIMSLFPQLKESNIGNSRDCSFEQMILQQTNGDGVDYVLNSLSEDKLAASVRCLGRGGTFLEIGKFDIINNSSLDMGTFAKEIIFRAVFADNLINMPKERKIIFDLIERDLKNGIIQPLHSTVFQVNEIEKAYRYLSTGKHVGKVLIQVRDSEKSPVSMPIKVTKKVYCNPNMVYIIVGGLGGVGLELADWLVLRGARILVLSSRKGVTTAYQSYRIKTWESYGCKIIVNTTYITNPQGCKKLLIESLVQGEIGGIFNLAVVLQDGIFDNQTADKFLECFLPKANVTQYLDEISRILCPKLQYFVIFSSASCGRGNAGQSNYGMANSIMERIIEQRAQDKLPAKAIQWGAIGEVGLVAEMAQDKIDLEIAGTIQQRISACLNVLDQLLTSTDPIVSSMVIAQKYAGTKLNLIESVLHIMGLRDLKTISKNATLAELGMDSLMAVEIKQALEREFEIILAAQDLRVLTFAKLQEISDSNCKDDTAKNNANESNMEVNNKNLLFRSLGDEKTSEEVILALNKFDANKEFDTCALFIPGIEGVAGPVLHKLGNQMTIPSYALQLHKSWEEKTFNGVIESIKKDVLNLYRNKKYFYLIGHSFGGVIAVELAKMLESNGLKGQIISMDGSMLLFKKFIEALMPGQEPTDENIQNFLVQQIAFEILPEIHPDAILIIMMESITWDEKLDKYITLMQKRAYTNQYLRRIGYAMMHRFKMILNTPNSDPNIVKIQTDITLVRPTINLFADIDEDYQLGQYTNGTVSINYVGGNHLTMLDDIKLYPIINEICNFKRL